MRAPAEHFLKLRSFGAPAVVLSLAIMGILRGFKDTRTSILCLGKFFPCQIASVGKCYLN